jgi:hypothetical protein
MMYHSYHNFRRQVSSPTQEMLQRDNDSSSNTDDNDSHQDIMNESDMKRMSTGADSRIPQSAKLVKRNSIIALNARSSDSDEGILEDLLEPGTVHTFICLNLHIH